MLPLYSDIFRANKSLKPSKQVDCAREKLFFASVTYMTYRSRKSETESSPRTPNPGCRYTDLKRDPNWCSITPLDGHKLST